MDGENQEQADYAGYQDLDGLKKGYRESSSEAKRLKERAERAEQMLQQTVAANQPRQVPTDPFSRLEQEAAIPASLLREAVRMELGPMIQEQFRPLAQMSEARNKIITRYPDYPEFEPKILQYVNADPELADRYNQMYATNAEAAMEYGRAMFTANQAKSNGAPRRERAPKSEAQIPTARGGESRVQQTDSGDQLVEQGREIYNKTGNPAFYAKARIRQVVSDEHLSR